MSGIPEVGGLLETPAARAVAAALVQFIWQGALTGVLTAILLAALRRSGPDVRYVVSTIALSLMLTLPVVTAIQEFRSLQVTATTRSASETVSRAAITQAPSGQRGEAASAASGRMWDAMTLSASPSRAAVPPLWRGVLLLWIAGVVVLTLRTAGGWLWVRRLRLRAAPASMEMTRAAARLARQIHVTRPVRLLQSTLVDVPTVIGWLKPAILFPAGALAGLSPLQLEAILAHELAHVRRHDYLVNLLQTMVETLLFYHPAVWWISRQIRIERENCCDDLAVSLCGDPVVYAQALADLEELRAPGGRLAIAASGGSLLKRVRRLIGPSPAGPAAGPLAAAASLALVLVFAGLAGAAAQEADGRDGAFASFADAGTAAQLGAGADHAREGAEHLREALQHLREQLQQLREAAARLGEDLVRFVPEHGDLLGQVPPAPPAAPTPPAPPAAPADVFDDPLVTPLPPAPPVPAWPGDVPAVHPPAPPAPPTPDARPAPLALPAPPVLPATPLYAAPGPPPPLAAPPQDAPRQRRGQSSGNFMWSNDREKLEVQYRGEVEFSDDDADVTRLEPGGYLRLRDGDRAVELHADESGTITRRFRVSGSERPFEPEGRAWLARVLPRFIRQTGIGAPARAARIYKARGAQGLLAEITLIEGSFGKRIYFTELLKMPALDPRTVETALAQAGREIDSDFELASLLIASERLAANEPTRKAWFQAARTIGSDFEMRRVLSAALERGEMPAPLLAILLDTATAIESDFELASLLVDVAKAHPLDAAGEKNFFRALDSVGSDFERKRVLSELVRRGGLGARTIEAALTSAMAIQSDFEAASLLVEVAKAQPVEGSLRAPFFRAAASVGSSFERGRVLQTVAKRGDASEETLLEVIKAAEGMGDFQSAQVLLAVAAGRPLTQQARAAYIDAAGRLGDFEQGRVLSALVRNERR